MPGFANKGAFYITKEPFTDWEKTVKRISKTVEDRLGAGITQVMKQSEVVLRETIRQDEVWPDEIAEKTSFDLVDGHFKVHFDDPRVVGLEYGDADGSAPAPLARTFADSHDEDQDAALTNVVRNATGL